MGAIYVDMDIFGAWRGWGPPPGAGKEGNQQPKGKPSGSTKGQGMSRHAHRGRKQTRSPFGWTHSEEEPVFFFSACRVWGSFFFCFCPPFSPNPLHLSSFSLAPIPPLAEVRRAG
jgi:hypothetical protein